MPLVSCLHFTPVNKMKEEKDRLLAPLYFTSTSTQLKIFLLIFLYLNNVSVDRVTNHPMKGVRCGLVGRGFDSQW